MPAELLCISARIYGGHGFRTHRRILEYRQSVQLNYWIRWECAFSLSRSDSWLQRVRNYSCLLVVGLLLRSPSADHYIWNALERSLHWTVGAIYPHSAGFCKETSTSVLEFGRPSPAAKRVLVYFEVKNKHERYYWTRKAPACLLTPLRHYGKLRLCINIHHYAPPIWCSVTHRAATSLAAPHCRGVSEGAMSCFKSITWKELC